MHGCYHCSLLMALARTIIFLSLSRKGYKYFIVVVMLLITGNGDRQIKIKFAKKIEIFLRKFRPRIFHNFQWKNFITYLSLPRCHSLEFITYRLRVNCPKPHSSQLFPLLIQPQFPANQSIKNEKQFYFLFSKQKRKNIFFRE